MNKSIITNGLALVLVVVGYALDNSVVKTVGLFALSGAITNWLAVHMLFEKVPGLYGSGVIPEHFEDFKSGIKHLIMEQFFNASNVARFMTNQSQSVQLDFTPIIKKLDLEPTFDSLVAVIQESSFGQMLGMFGGVAALEPLKQPFIQKMTDSLATISQEPAFKEAIQAQLAQPELNQDLQLKITQIVEQRLSELTPQLVKEIIQHMIKQHLGWLVVWGGVFGGLIGLVAAILV